MGRTPRYLTQESKLAAKAAQKAAWEKTFGGQFIRKQQREAHSRRHTTATRIPRLSLLPSQLYIWLKCPESPDYNKHPNFCKALHDDYDTEPIAHWLEDPPFEDPEEYRATRAGSAYEAETKQLVYAVHARRMRAVQAREVARRQFEERVGRFYAMDAWRNQARHLLYQWNRAVGGVADYNTKTQAREHAMSLVHLYWLSTELDRLYHLKFLKSH
uniref:CHHC U11-48K-type domain-containing protein n=1 Tax=Mycena chlorophos TaxID=658473 RepID=A0ABQ0L6L6_MYCCL|nr:predicted protein [Mycena chlorophos]